MQRKKILAYICISLIFLTCSQTIIEGKDESCAIVKSDDIEGFYREKENSIDVLAIGDSNLYRGLAPQILWEQQHITSYVLASASQSPWLTYYLFQDALKYQKPKVVILDPYELYRTGNSTSTRYCKVINSMQGFDWKLSAINSLDSNFTNVEKNVLIMHALEQLIRNTFVNLPVAAAEKEKKLPYSKQKGFYLNVTQKPFLGNYNYMYTNKSHDIRSVNRKYYDKIIQICKKEGIQVVLVKIPSATDWSYQQYNETLSYAQKQGIAYLDLNFMSGENAINWTTDTKDNGTHMNVYGAYKVTRTIGMYLRQTYGLESNQDVEVKSNYDASLKAFHKKMQEMEVNNTQGDDH